MLLFPIMLFLYQEHAPHGYVFNVWSAFRGIMLTDNMLYGERVLP